ncbi:MAG: ATP-grasp domain-containing protein [Bacteroidota bacterium]
MFSREVNILIIDNNSPFVLPLLRSFSGFPNVHLDVLLSSDLKPQEFRYSRHLRKIYQVSSLNHDNFKEVVLETSKKSNADLIIPTREWISELLFKNRESLEKHVKIHPVPESDTLETTGNKWKLSQWLKQNEFPTATTSGIDKNWTGSYPMLIKPVRGISGEGIILIQNAEELKSTIGKNGIGKEGFFMQEYVQGYDIDMSLFAIKGKILVHTMQRGIISGRLTYSKGIEFIKNRDLYQLVERIIKKLNYTGIAHLDFRYDNDRKEYVLIDFNARYWSSVQGSRAMGVNFPLLATAYSLGITVEYPDYRSGHFYFTTTALKVKLKNLFSNQNYPVKLKDTQLQYLFLDPQPELGYLMQQLLKPIRQIFHKR